MSNTAGSLGLDTLLSLIKGYLSVVFAYKHTHAGVCELNLQWFHGLNPQKLIRTLLAKS